MQNTAQEAYVTNSQHNTQNTARDTNVQLLWKIIPNSTQDTRVTKKQQNT